MKEERKRHRTRNPTTLVVSWGNASPICLFWRALSDFAGGHWEKSFINAAQTGAQTQNSVLQGLKVETIQNFVLGLFTGLNVALLSSPKTGINPKTFPLYLLALFGLRKHMSYSIQTAKQQSEFIARLKLKNGSLPIAHTASAMSNLLSDLSCVAERVFATLFPRYCDANVHERHE